MQRDSFVAVTQVTRTQLGRNCGLFGSGKIKSNPMLSFQNLRFIYLMCMSDLPACMSVYHMSAVSVGPRRGLGGPLELEL